MANTAHEALPAQSRRSARRRDGDAEAECDQAAVRRYRRTMRYGQMHTLVDPPDVREIEESVLSWLGATQ